jgi:hypothetical protein
VSDRAHWKDEPEQHDYPAASDFLSLVLDPSVTSVVVAGLQAAPVEHRKAKDLLRASGLALLGPENHHVARDLGKVHDGVELSPVLLVRGDLRAGRPLVVGRRLPPDLRQLPPRRGHRHPVQDRRPPRPCPVIPASRRGSLLAVA